MVILDGEALRAERGDEQEDEDQLRARPVCHVRLGASERGRGGEGDGEGVEGQSFLDLGHGERGSSGVHPAGVRTVSPSEDGQRGDEEQERGGVRVEEGVREGVRPERG